MESLLTLRDYLSAGVISADNPLVMDLDDEFLHGVYIVLLTIYFRRFDNTIGGLPFFAVLAAGSTFLGDFIGVLGSRSYTSIFTSFYF